MSVQERREILKLIVQETKTGEWTLDEEFVKKIKTFCKRNDRHVELVYECILNQLSIDHSQIRYLALLLFHILFSRSKRFRELGAADFPRIVDLCIGPSAEKALPAPQDFAKALRKKALECIEEWNKEHGSKYTQVKLGFLYLRDHLKMKFPEVHIARQRQELERQEREKRKQEILFAKAQQALRELDDMEPQMKSLLQELDSALELLFPVRGLFDGRETGDVNRGQDKGKGRVQQTAPTEDEEEEAEAAEEGGYDEPEYEYDRDDIDQEPLPTVQQLGYGTAHSVRVGIHPADIPTPTATTTTLAAAVASTAAGYGLVRSEAAPVVLATVQDGQKLIENSYLPNCTRWLSILTKVDPPAHSRGMVDRTLKRVVDIRNALRIIMNRSTMVDVLAGPNARTDRGEGHRGDDDDDDDSFGSDDDNYDTIPIRKEGYEEGPGVDVATLPHDPQFNQHVDDADLEQAIIASLQPPSGPTTASNIAGPSNTKRALQTAFKDDDTKGKGKGQGKGQGKGHKRAKKASKLIDITRPLDNSRTRVARIIRKRQPRKADIQIAQEKEDKRRYRENFLHLKKNV